MSRPGWNGRPAAGSASSASLSAGLTLLVSLLAALTPARAQQVAPAQTQPAQLAPVGPQDGAGVAVSVDAPAPATDQPGAPLLPTDVQVVRFQVPEGSTIEVLGPSPTPVPHTETPATLTVGLKRGVGYRLRLSNIPEREGAELFPVIEVVGHLHRPDGIDPAKYPIRVIFTLEDIDAVLNQSRMLTKVLYLEDPDQALPVRMPRDQIPIVSISPTENPLRVAAAMGRPMAIVRLGGRRPTIEEVQGGPGDFGLDTAARMGENACPYLLQDGSRCPMVAGPPCTAPKPTVQSLLPRDEFLCDGGDRGMPIQVGNDGGLGGVDPRDAAVRFDIGLGPRVQPRTLPTNVVCIYAPRFAEVRVTTGTNQTVDVQHLTTNVVRERTNVASIAAGSRRLVQNQTPEMSRNRERPSGFKGRIGTDEESNNRAVGGYENVTQLSSNRQKQSPELARNRQQSVETKDRVRLGGIKTAEAPVVTGITEGASQAVRVWGPHQMTGVETPPNRPGLAVIKRVSATEAEPGDTVTYVIHYRNMGNTPIRSVVIVDSLLPRLEYVKGTARGPAGTAFGSSFNRAGSTELRWALPGVLAPGASGQVSFNVIVR
ncbi:MAG: hypothetical protein ACYC61_30840 [Isosphaeraceae bacterium]